MEQFVQEFRLKTSESQKTIEINKTIDREKTIETHRTNPSNVSFKSKNKLMEFMKRNSFKCECPQHPTKSSPQLLKTFSQPSLPSKTFSERITKNSTLPEESLSQDFRLLGANSQQCFTQFLQKETCLDELFKNRVDNSNGAPNKENIPQEELYENVGCFHLVSKESKKTQKENILSGLKRAKEDFATPEEVDVEFEYNTVEVAVAKMKETFLEVIECIKSGKPFVLKLRRRRGGGCHVFKDERIFLKPEGKCGVTMLRHDGPSRKLINLMLYLMGKIAFLISTNGSCTKRQIYYEINNSGYSISRVYYALDCLSVYLNVPLWDLGIFSSGGGLVHGNLTLVLKGGEKIFCLQDRGILIPQNLNIICGLESNARFILIVEKDTVFQKLLEGDLINNFEVPFILLTGKGFPDFNTRHFVNKLWVTLLIPIFIMVDCNPSGIEIMMTYRFGCKHTGHLSPNLATPGIRWIGVFPSELTSLNVEKQPLTKRDKNKLKELVQRPYLCFYPKMKKEIILMAENGFKADLEGLTSREYLSNVYVPNKIYLCDYI